MRGIRIVFTLGLIALTLGACSRNEPEQPAPVQQTTDDDAARRAEEERLAREAAERERLAREAAEREAAAERERMRAILTERIHFDYDDSSILPQAQDKLVQKVPILRANPDIRMMIEGHADERGSIEYNLALGLRRANAARDFLVNYGLDAGRFQIRSLGEEQPLVPGTGEAAWSQNRRAEFVVTAGDLR